MLNFNYFSDRAEVNRALTSRLNHNCMDALRNQDRKKHRSHFSEVVWIVPLEGEEPDFSQAVPAVSRDLSIQGLALIHNAPLENSPVVVGVPGAPGTSEMNFFHCNVQHCSALGYGFFLVGLFPERVIFPSTADLATWENRSREFQQDPQPEPVA